MSGEQVREGLRSAAPLSSVEEAAHRKQGLTRMPLWLRVATPLVALAVLYHYWLPVSNAFTQDVLDLRGTSHLVSALTFYIIVGKVWPYLLIGIGAGATIHGYVPQGLLSGFMGKGNWWGVPAAVLIGVPLYSNAAGIIPIVQALIEKGAALGTVLAFMMSVVAISLPEAMILRRVVKWQLIFVFFGVVTLGILMVGFLFNGVL